MFYQFKILCTSRFHFPWFYCWQFEELKNRPHENTTWESFTRSEDSNRSTITLLLRIYNLSMHDGRNVCMWKLLQPIIHEENLSFVEEKVRVLMDEKSNNHKKWIMLFSTFYWTIQIITGKPHAYFPCYSWMVLQV